MTKCIGCKCCVVACNEQNGNPAEINWRRVGEVEGGYYPHTQRHHLSMGCNHCLEPSCLIGCPVEAYTKDPVTGVVMHSADACIGCQYCTWNCSYGVPQYNPERGVVGKCDMCHNRLSDGMAPACVAACPEGAIAIEIVNIAEWRARLSVGERARPAFGGRQHLHHARHAAGKSGARSGRVDTQPRGAGASALAAGLHAGADAACAWARSSRSGCWISIGPGADLKIAALASLALAGISLGASTLHLGRPIYAWRALRGSAAFVAEPRSADAFAVRGAAGAFAGMLFFGSAGPRCGRACHRAGGPRGHHLLGAHLYRSGAPGLVQRLHRRRVLFDRAAAGPAVRARCSIRTCPPRCCCASVAGGAAQLITQSGKFLWLSRSEVFELRASSLLLVGPLAAAVS